jgi:hypothetical protein
MKKVLIGLILCLFLATPSFANWTTATILDGVGATGASTDYDVQNYVDKTFYIVASGVTTGATVLIQTSPDNSNWSTISTNVVTGNGTTEIAVTGMFHRFIRANVSSWTDGAYTVIMFLDQ